LVGIHGRDSVVVDGLETLFSAIFSRFFQGPETTVPAFAGTVFININ